MALLGVNHGIHHRHALKTSPRRITRHCGVCWGQGAWEFVPSVTGIAHRRLWVAVNHKASWPALCASRLTLGTPSDHSSLLKLRLAVFRVEIVDEGHQGAMHRRDQRHGRVLCRLAIPGGGRALVYRPIIIRRPG